MSRALRAIRAAAAAIAAAAALPAAAAAQAAPARPLILDSGFIDRPGATPAVVFRRTLSVPAPAAWTRLRFAASNLPDGSSVRLTALADGGVQILDAAGLRASGLRSAYFNGRLVRVELVAGPNTRHNRVAVESIERGQPPIVRTSLCGADDRTRSSDQRIGRLAGVCTAFLIAPDLALTAGHCLSQDSVLEFNVPSSSPNGQINFAPPQDQYGVQLLNRVFVQGVPGADWALARVQPNVMTGRLPTEAYGVQPFRLGIVPPAPNGRTIRITGFGTSNTPTLSQVQQTDVGPLARIGADFVHYAVDTTSGTSGAPIVDDATGFALGIHTDAGCSLFGGSNYGTSLDRLDLLATIRSHLRGRLGTFGSGCPGASGTPTLTLAGSPVLGGTVAVRVSSTPPQTAGFMILGLSDRAWGRFGLPLALDPFGMPGCTLYASLDWAGPADTTAATAYAIPIPLVAELVGASAFVQYLLAEPGANVAGLLASNGGAITIAR